MVMSSFKIKLLNSDVKFKVKPEDQHTQTTACDYRFGDVMSAATFQTFCFGRGFSKARDFKDKIRLRC